MFNPRFGKIPHTVEQMSLCTTSVVLSPLTATTESLHAAMKTVLQKVNKYIKHFKKRIMVPNMYAFLTSLATEMLELTPQTPTFGASQT